MLHTDDAVIFVLLLVYSVIPLDILIVVSKQVKWSLLRNMITVQEDRRNLPRNLGFGWNANILSAPFKIQQPKLDSYKRIRSKGAHCSFEGDGVPGYAALWEGDWVARVGLCGAVWGCVGHAAGGGNRIARAKGGLGEASRETLLQDAQKCSPTHETMAIGILSMSKKPTPQWAFPHRNGSNNLTTCNKPICKLRAHEYHRKWRWYDQSFYFDDSLVIDLSTFISSWLKLARDE